MNLEPAPRLPKWIFLAIDAGLLLIAFLIVSFAKDPYAPLPFVSAVLCAALAAMIGLVPFLIDYAADSAEFVQRERERMNEQAARLHASVESLARAAAQIKAVEEAVHKSAREAETLPYRMQEKLAEFNEALAAKEETDREALETELEELRAANSDQLKGVAEKIAKAAADWTALEVATRKQLSGAEASVAKLQASIADTATKLEAATAAAASKFDTQVAAALKELDARVAALKAAAAAVPTKIAVESVAVPPAPVAASDERRAEPVEAPAAETPVETPAGVTATESAPADASVPAPAEPAIDLSAMVAEPPKPKKPRAPRKPKAEENLAAMSETPVSEPAAIAAATPEPAAVVEAPSVASEPASTESTPAPSADESSSEPAAGPVESSSSSDGATRLLATAYIGIGNKLFIRGDGPGLTWDHGVPMQFVSIGKWGWSTHDAAGPIRCKLYKNDETAALIGELVLEAGRHTEVTAQF